MRLAYALTALATLSLTACGQVNLLGTERTGAAAIEGFDDPLETEVVVNTFAYERPRLLVRGSADPSFRAAFSKGEGTTPILYQLYIKTSSEDWMRWESVRYQVAGAVRSADLDQIGTDVECHESKCSHYETVGTLIGRDDLDAIAQGAAPVTFRLDSGRFTDDRDVSVDPAEVRVFLAAVDSVRTPR